MTTLIYGLLLYSLILFSSIRTEFTEEDAERLDEFIGEVLECNNIPGMTLSVVQNGNVLVTKGYGVADLDTGAPVTENSMFVIASVTKSMSTALLAKILDEYE